jgi:hypothetical protein
MKKIIFLITLLPQMIMSQYPNILIGDMNEPNEPSICMDPKNTNRLVAGSNLDLYYFSDDGGLTWASGILNSSYGVWGDPVVIVDTNGHCYFFHLSVPSWTQWLDRIVCQKSTDGGQTWSDGSFMGLNGNKDQDKEWGVVDRVTNNIYVTWTQFDSYGSTNITDSTHIMFSRSLDGGITWSPAVRIDQHGGNCLDGDNTVEGAVPAVGPNGEIYVSWAGPLGLVFTKSMDRGLTWPSENVFVSDFPGGWDYSIPGISRANGLPITCCDLSGGPHHGTIYINWSDQRNGNNDTDIWMVKSTDGGTTWSISKRINDDPPGKHQFFCWMTIDQATGYLYVVFYDRRNYSGTQTDVWMAVSRDGGETFSNFKVSEESFAPSSSIFFGDYTHITAHNNIVRPIWTRLHNGQLSIWTALVDSIFVGIIPDRQAPFSFSLEQNYPNPVKDITWFSYKVHEPSVVTIKVYDIYGNVVVTLVDHEYRFRGKYIEQFEPERYGLRKGFYWFSLMSDDRSEQRKMIVE